MTALGGLVGERRSARKIGGVVYHQFSRKALMRLDVEKPALENQWTDVHWKMYGT
jgi:hypothetical protein